MVKYNVNVFECECVLRKNRSVSMYKSFIKRLIDILLSLSAIAMLALPMLIITVAIKIDDPGPAIFKQKRVGKNKELFMLYKFRSMKVSTPDIPTHLMENPEQYISRIGRILRKTSLDELPQLFNVLAAICHSLAPARRSPCSLSSSRRPSRFIW